MKLSLILSLFFLFSTNAHAQLKWKPVNAEFGELPESVHVYRCTDSLNTRPFIAYCVVADLKDRKLLFTTETGMGKRYTPSQYDSIYGKSLLTINGTFFSFETNRNLNVVIKNDSLLAYNVPALKSKLSDSFYYPTRSAIGITRSRRADVAWLFTDTAMKRAYAFQHGPLLAKGLSPDPQFADLKTVQQWKFWKMRTAIGGGPVLVHNSVTRITNREEQMFANGIHDLHPRTAMGYTKDRKLVLVVVQGRQKGIAEGINLEELAQLMIELNCVEALNLDGGGSSCMLINGKETIRPAGATGAQRAVPAVFVIRKK